ncbi:MAG TPA: rhomboid family intramembrane serine protease, partial [Acidimicrobiales bacterium]
ASGAVFGLFGAAAMGLRQRGINVMQTNIGVLLVINLVFTFVIPGISVGAHLGGLAGGALCGGVMLRERPSPTATVRGVLVAAALTLAAGAGAVAIAHP